MRRVIPIILFLAFCISSNSAADVKQNDHIKQDLGYQSHAFGSQRQAITLIDLIKKHPGKNDYQIFYKTDRDVVVFGCNLKKNVIIRIHQDATGHGTQEMWSGYIMDRLNNAAGGGSLNNTPTGKIMGIHQSF